MNSILPRLNNTSWYKVLLQVFLIVFTVGITFLFINEPAHAQTPTPTDSAAAVDGRWVEDPEVTFVGKTATRSDEFLNWTLQNYDWLCVQKDSNGNCNNQDNPLTSFWVLVRNTVYILMVLFLLGTAFVMIVTRGQNITVMRFLPRFVFIIILVTLSFSLVQFIYIISDIIQGFLFRIEDPTTQAVRQIGSQDLLHIAFGYDFTGFRRVGSAYEESAFISLLLVRLTAFTYYTMTGILLIRKIILWFFIIVSPVFPLLLFYAPVRNTAKIWIGEFFRWLLYGPLFALFLHGLVIMWQKGIPLPFDFSKVGDSGSIVYPTAVNILLGGPGQTLGISNSVNLRDTFALYVVALLMLWVVILLPFLLLNIFLDYIATLPANQVFKQIVARSSNFINSRYPSPVTPPSGTPPQPSFGAGVARALPFMSKGSGVTKTIPLESQEPTTTANQVYNIQNIHNTTDVMKLTNLSVPKMRDIARYESSLISRDTSRREEVSRVNTTLQHIANPTLASSPVEREKFSQLKEKLIQQKQKGDPLATSILSASQTFSTSTSNVTNKSNVSNVAASKSSVSNSNVSSVSNVKEGTQQVQGKVPGVQTALGKQTQVLTRQQATLPVVNRVQQVSIEDYEEVRKMWVDNYQNLEPPKGLDGVETSRKNWIKNDIDRINQAITLLTSVDPEKNKQGMNMVSNILPFLLIGGFSRSEVIAYMKAKMEAGKSVLDTVAKKEEEEETMVARDEHKQEQAGTMQAEQKLPTEEEKGKEMKYFGDDAKNEKGGNNDNNPKPI